MSVIRKTFTTVFGVGATVVFAFVFGTIGALIGLLLAAIITALAGDHAAVWGFFGVGGALLGIIFALWNGFTSIREEWKTPYYKRTKGGHSAVPMSITSPDGTIYTEGDIGYEVEMLIRGLNCNQVTRPSSLSVYASAGSVEWELRELRIDASGGFDRDTGVCMSHAGSAEYEAHQLRVDLHKGNRHVGGSYHEPGTLADQLARLRVDVATRSDSSLDFFMRREGSAYEIARLRGHARDLANWGR